MRPKKMAQKKTWKMVARRRDDWSTLPPGFLMTRRDRDGPSGLDRRRAGNGFAFDQVKVDAHRGGPRGDALGPAGLGDAAQQGAVLGGELAQLGLLARDLVAGERDAERAGDGQQGEIQQDDDDERCANSLHDFPLRDPASFRVPQPAPLQDQANYNFSMTRSFALLERGFFRTSSRVAR